MRKLFVATALVTILSLVVFGAAAADGTVNWTGHGEDNLPCPGGGHWVLSNAQGVTGATLHVNGNDYAMSQSGQGSWSADSGPLGDSVTASVSYTGDAEKTPQLQLSHCNAPPPPTETPVPPPTPTETLEPTPTNTPEGPTATSTEGPSPTPGAPTNTPHPHKTPPPEKPTGAGDSFPIAGALLVFVAGLGAAFVSASRRRLHG